MKRGPVPCANPSGTGRAARPSILPMDESAPAAVEDRRWCGENEERDSEQRIREGPDREQEAEHRSEEPK